MHKKDTKMGGKYMTDIRKNTLWRVPLYCIIAGKISFHLIIYLSYRIR